MTSPIANSDPNPALVFDTLTAYQKSAALRGAIELGLFTQVARGHTRVESLASACQADARAVRILCDFLVVNGFLNKDDSQYALTPTAAVFLNEDSPNYLGSIHRFMHSPDLLNAFRDVASLVRRGRTELSEHGTVDVEYEGWIEFARSMVPMMMPAAMYVGEAAARLKPGRARVLDVAAGHGMFGICVAQRNAEASIVALDWPQVLTVAKENAQARGVADRFELLAGDALSIDLGRGYDLVLLANFLHHFDRPTCEAFMRRVAESLSDDGAVITVEFVPNEDRISPPTPATFAFMMLGTTPSGDAYTLAEYEAMWRSVGLTRHEMTNVPKSPQQMIVSRR